MAVRLLYNGSNIVVHVALYGSNITLYGIGTTFLLW